MDAVKVAMTAVGIITDRNELDWLGSCALAFIQRDVSGGLTVEYCYHRYQSELPCWSCATH
jgi:hypothetical protein